MLNKDKGKEYQKNLIDLSKEEVWVSFNNCFEDLGVCIGMENLKNVISNVLKLEEEKIYYGLIRIDKRVLKSLYNKIEECRYRYNESESYIKYAEEQYRIDKNLSENCVFTLALPNSKMVITLEELITFYKLLIGLERDYSKVIEVTSCFYSMESYFSTIRNLKENLEKRMIYKFIYN